MTLRNTNIEQYLIFVSTVGQVGHAKLSLVGDIIIRSSPTYDLVDWNSGVSIHPSVCKKFFRFPSNLVCG